MKKTTKTLALIITIFLLSGCTFAGDTSSITMGTPGFLMGVWHGILAPLTLILRFFLDNVQMYATPNSGLGYDAGFLLGFIGAIPLGWLATIISLMFYFLA